MSDRYHRAPGILREKDTYMAVCLGEGMLRAGPWEEGTTVQCGQPRRLHIARETSPARQQAEMHCRRSWERMNILYSSVWSENWERRAPDEAGTSL